MGDIPKDASLTGTPIGRPDDIVRVLSFGGGGFDTTMQLGSVHALLPIQGRAPDAVVGLSAGAINAVVLADVFQAGEALEKERPWNALQTPEEKVELQRRRLEARVARFREVLDHLFRAPQELIEGVLPDAYQVDARKPLQTVQSPIFVQEERERRDEAVANRTGLVRLYNHILGVRLGFGTLTRIVRRALGFVAAGEVRRPGGAWSVRTIEIMRVWMHAGSALWSLSRVAPYLTLSPAWQFVVGFLPDRIRDRLRREKGYTAGAIIFRFPFIEAVARELFLALVFALIVTLWVALTFGVLLIPWTVRDLFGLPMGAGALYAALLTALAVVAVVAWPSFRDFDRTTSVRMLVDAGKALLFVALVVGGWTAVLFLAVVAVGTIGAVIAGPGLEAGVMTAGPSVLDAGVQTADRFMELVFKGGAYGALLLTALVVARAVWVSFRGPRPAPGHGMRNRWMRAILSSYRIRSSLLSIYPLQRFFAQLFDPEYWGDPPMDEVVEDSLADNLEPWPGGRPRPGPKRKPVEHYSHDDRLAAERIHVGLAAADLETGRLEVIRPSVSVVSGLTAATAAVPLFPPMRLCGKHYVDGANVSNEPMQGVFELLRGRVRDDIRAVHVYSVTPLPTSGAEGRSSEPSDRAAERPPDRHMSLVEAAARAGRLRRLRDATLERRLTELYSRALPADGPGVHRVPVQDPATGKTFERPFIRAWVTPVEPDRPVNLNARVFRAGKYETRRLVLETIADGCRASLQVMVRPSVADKKEMKCCTAVARHLASRRRQAGSEQDRADLDALRGLRLPGSSEAGGGPGIGLICQHCALRRDAEGKENRGEQTLSFERRWEQLGPAWPHERERTPAGQEGRYVAPEPRYRVEARKAVESLAADAEVDEAALWPWPRSDHRPREQPVRSFLFSGGVFRGVYQMGVLNALTDLELKPDLIGGASVGSITAAMTAAVYAHEGTERHALVCRLAAVYLALDRLVLTDRFADFIRNLTVRAAGARFSIQEADRVFRRFDAPGLRSFGADARRVLAGIERLFYMSPYEVGDLVRAIRHRERAEVTRLLSEHTQEWLDRMDVGDEILGAEPLRRLITEYVHSCLPRDGWHYPGGPSFDDLREAFGIHFLATTTNLTREKLEILGLAPRRSGQEGSPVLGEGLLASSAFPLIFRPREGHEVYPATRCENQFIDGGIIDNLPLDAIAEFLLAASERSGSGPTGGRWKGLIARRPRKGESPVPHLVFSASLEVAARAYEGPDLADLSWPELLNRTRQLGYNRKLDQYRLSQENLRAIQRLHDSSSPSRRRDLEPLDLELVVVKPNWLCKTFAFHPMMGFRRDRQVRSIAHGCATTLLEFGRYRRKSEPTLRAWGVNLARVPDHTTLDDALAARKGAHTHVAGGECWLRPGHACPFSMEATSGLELPAETRHQLASIHRVCGERRTHGTGR